MAPRTSRSVAQRYAEAARKRRKALNQRPASAAAEAESPTLRHAPEETAEAAPSTPPAAEQRATPAARWRTASRPHAPARHAPADFSQQYRYVWQDVRRIALITSLILVVLIALTFVIR